MLVCFLLYLLEIYYQQNLNIAWGLTYDPHNMTGLQVSTHFKGVLYSILGPDLLDLTVAV